MSEPTTCPLCDWTSRPFAEGLPATPALARAGGEFLLADHLMIVHLPWRANGRELRCFCGQVMSNKIVVYMAHLQAYGGAHEHHRAWQLGVDP